MKLNKPAPTTKAPAGRFTGDVYLSPLHTGEAPSRLTAALVHFTPGARTNWHSHPLGQTLHCTEGTGLVATRDGTVILMRPGDTVHTPPGEEHWHGATPGSLMSHLAMVEHEDGHSATWLEPVSDADYAAAHTRATR
ncbi:MULTISPECIES: cupin domain-containing protein [Arthrobacter]|uniref:Cupin domain-containing protein n=1 Tax=Arthrobacter terricola TaxID=2547396 RepID=A0A4R5KEX5_9MICC|nr:MULTISPECIES: cupin domain-containing protein [Arthrobacter]MBT8162082.1 cupin domain-containing protein [Arthrobacter sp. GN70]TDF93901.1 cupin domain-containing protein [Arthrobacter terricola]